MPVADVVFNVGFTDPIYFTRRFRRGVPLLTQRAARLNACIFCIGWHLCKIGCQPFLYLVRMESLNYSRLCCFRLAYRILKIRRGGYVYVDKTALLYEMANSGSYYFLSRPRRFGKSLLSPRWRPTSWDKKICSNAWPSNSWKRTGRKPRAAHRHDFKDYTDEGG